MYKQDKESMGGLSLISSLQTARLLILPIAFLSRHKNSELFCDALHRCVHDCCVDTSVIDA
ncbi:uncharacterized protein PHALS_14665 [Plasmopara halstedii]|uniref:Uncharacterized protein n=1 Tax=Plasmopara halstedii TaxID=4781 RepID=A0A0P1ANP4_PLAHL|nr:uncharacterized protein PHALS_14665 [Plasmopara halstedii]CEG42862.1 hypothetical protein PHALS_14665 [Plasmopara halstedii]|eukprot:XP_024579231.1 hypothetical protein PHALS_14665 [Plasmopara halstedii]